MAAMNKNTKILIGVLVAVLVIVVAWGAMTMPDRRSPSEKVGDAIGELDNGLDNAARELEDRTPAERLRDNVEDATDSQ